MRGINLMSRIKDKILADMENDFIQNIVSYFMLVDLIIHEDRVIYKIMDLNDGVSFEVSEELSRLENGKINIYISKWLRGILEDNLITGYDKYTNFKNKQVFPLFFNAWIKNGYFEAWKEDNLTTDEVVIIPNWENRRGTKLIRGLNSIDKTLAYGLSGDEE